jgi:hypothetical protein
MTCTVPEFSQIRPDQLDVALGFGEFACVSRVTGTDFVAKIPFSTTSQHIPIEGRIYERLGEHPLILKYYQQAVFISGGETLPALVLQFLKAGTLDKNLKTSRWKKLWTT